MPNSTSGGAEHRALQYFDREDLIDLWSISELLRPWNEPSHDIDANVDQGPEGLLVLVEQERVIGSVMVDYCGHRGWVNYLAVHPDHRSRGFGQLLITVAENRLAGLGCSRLNLQIRTADRDVVSFCQRLGYEFDDVVSMGKRLAAAVGGLAGWWVGIVLELCRVCQISRISSGSVAMGILK